MSEVSSSRGHGRPRRGPQPVTRHGAPKQQHTEPASAHLRMEGTGSLGTAGVKGQHAGVAWVPACALSL